MVELIFVYSLSKTEPNDALERSACRERRESDGKVPITDTFRSLWNFVYTHFDVCGLCGIPACPVNLATTSYDTLNCQMLVSIRDLGPRSCSPAKRGRSARTRLAARELRAGDHQGSTHSPRVKRLFAERNTKAQRPPQLSCPNGSRPPLWANNSGSGVFWCPHLHDPGENQIALTNKV